MAGPSGIWSFILIAFILIVVLLEAVELAKHVTSNEIFLVTSGGPEH